MKIEKTNKLPYKGKKRGRKKGTRVDLIPSWKTTYMFMLWCEQQNVEYVARESGVAAKTVRRYKKLHGWDTQLANIMAEIEIQGGSKEEELAKRHALQQTRILKNQAFRAAMKHGYTTGKDASLAFDRFQRLEKQLLEGAPSTTVNLILIAAQQFRAAKALETSKRVPAEIVSVKDSDDDE